MTGQGFRWAAALLTTALLASPAWAGTYADDLGQCLVNSTSMADRSHLVQWVFAGISLHPDVKAMASVTPEQRETLNRQAAVLMQRLVTVDCRTEAVAAVKFEGPDTLGEAFSVLGQVAVRGLMSDPAVTEGLSGLDKYSDTAKWDELFKDAGVPVPKDQPAAPSP